MNVADHIARIRAGLDELRSLDAELRMPGAKQHRYQLNPPIAAARLAEVEARFGLALPEGYRAFITQLGDGGAGPYWGLHPLGVGLERVTELWGDEPLSGRFPLEADVDFGALAGQPADWKEHLRRLETDAAYVAGWEALQERYHAASTYAGTLPICDFGCGEFYFMVVRGAEPGRVWVNGIDNGTGLFSMRIDFVELYARWLADTIARARAREFGARNVPWAALWFGDNPRSARLAAVGRD